MISLLALLVVSALALCYSYIWVIVLFHELGHLITCLLYRRKAVQLRVAFPPGVSFSLKGFRFCIGLNVFAGGGVMAEECRSRPEALADLVLAWILPAAVIAVLNRALAYRLAGGVWSNWLAFAALLVVLAGGAYYEARTAHKTEKPG